METDIKQWLCFPGDFTDTVLKMQLQTLNSIDNHFQTCAILVFAGFTEHNYLV